MSSRTVAALTAALAVAIVLPGGAPARLAPEQPAGAQLVVRPAGLVLQTPAYQLVLSRQTGALLAIVDRISGTRLVQGQNGCQWGARSTPDGGYIGGCAFVPQKAGRFSYRWNADAGTLTLTYLGDEAQDRNTNAVVTITPSEDHVDLRMALENHRGQTIVNVNFPSDLYVDAGSVQAGYAPNFLPGVRLGRGFFSRVGDNVERYPSRWAFADYLALDVGRSSFALYSVNPAPAPLAPVDLGFLRNGLPAPCSSADVCVTHLFHTWIRDGESWRSPVVRLRFGQTVRQTILAYRSENGIDDYPSLREKLGESRLDTLARAPLIKADETRGLPPFRLWAPELDRLPSPALVHPVAFQAGGFDENDPDFLPPDAQWGTTAELSAAVEAAHARGQLVMPYLNMSWWDDGSPTVLGLPPPLTLRDVSTQDSQGRPVSEAYGPHVGYLVSPTVPFVRDRVARLFEEWRSDVPADCLFFDQIGARMWRYDFNPTEPTPLAYDDGWLALMQPYRDRCLMMEDGWDRLAASSSGFMGGALLMQREFAEPDTKWGPGNWEPYPLADWLLGDKVLLYQHDLYEGTMTDDPEVLTFNEAFGFVLSFEWNGTTDSLSSPWLELVGRLQRTLGPYYAGAQLTAFDDVAPGVTRSTFADGYTVIANWTGSVYETGGYGIAPDGFLARTEDGSVLAGAFASTFAGAPLPPGTTYRLVEGGRTTYSAVLTG